MRFSRKEHKGRKERKMTMKKKMHYHPIVA